MALSYLINNLTTRNNNSSRTGNSVNMSSRWNKTKLIITVCVYLFAKKQILLERGRRSGLIKHIVAVAFCCTTEIIARQQRLRFQQSSCRRKQQNNITLSTNQLLAGFCQHRFLMTWSFRNTIGSKCVCSLISDDAQRKWSGELTLLSSEAVHKNKTNSKVANELSYSRQYFKRDLKSFWANICLNLRVSSSGRPLPPVDHHHHRPSRALFSSPFHPHLASSNRA